MNPRGKSNSAQNRAQEVIRSNNLKTVDAFELKLIEQQKKLKKINA